MAFPPSTAYILVEIGTGVQLLELGVKVVENLRRGMYTFLRLAECGCLSMGG